jgi:cobalt-zinc-cadmium efflux system outer membrane protein
MRKVLVLMLLATAGCQACPHDDPLDLEGPIQAVAVPHTLPATAAPVVSPACHHTSPPLPISGPLNLRTLWDLTLVSNPALREAAADVEAARGRLIQAGLYPNPKLIYEQSTIGSRIAPQGNFLMQVNQEIVTAGKRRLDQAVAAKETEAAGAALLAEKFAALTRVRRAYYDYIGRELAVAANQKVVAALEKAVLETQQLVEKVKTRPRIDLLRIEALHEEAQINLLSSRVNRDAAWRQLATEVGLPQLPQREPTPDLPASVPEWEAAAVEQRVLAVNYALKKANLEVDSARLALARARAQAIPNIAVGAGYSLDNLEHTAGAVVALETPLPLWDRNQGNIHTAQAQLARTHAVLRTTANRLTRETAAAFASYEAARRQVERLATRVVPRLEVSLQQLHKGYYQLGAPQATFADLLQAEQGLLSASLTLAEARRTLWLAIADLQGLMELDMDDDGGLPPVHPVPAASSTCPPVRVQLGMPMPTSAPDE